MELQNHLVSNKSYQPLKWLKYIQENAKSSFCKSCLPNFDLLCKIVFTQVKKIKSKSEPIVFSLLHLWFKVEICSKLHYSFIKWWCAKRIWARTKTEKDSLSNKSGLHQYYLRDTSKSLNTENLQWLWTDVKVTETDMHMYAKPNTGIIQSLKGLTRNTVWKKDHQQRFCCSLQCKRKQEGGGGWGGGGGGEKKKKAVQIVLKYCS